MNQTLRAAVLGALLATPLGALAQQSLRTPDPADPAAAVAPIAARPAPADHSNHYSTPHQASQQQ